MKKRILILSIAILVLTFCMAACRKPAQVVTASSIEVVAGSVITECNVGDTPDFSGIKVKVTYSDSTTKEIGYADVQLSTIDTSSAGDKTVTVTYGELSTTFKVTVKEVEAPPATLTSIKIVNGTVPSALYIGQSFDASGLQVEAVYSDGTKKILSLEQVQASTVDATTAGDKTFTVTYEGKTDSITVKVYDIISIKVVSGTIASKLFVGETLNTANVEVIVTYGDGTSKIIPATGLTVGTIDTTTYGVKKVDIIYNGITVKHEVEVVGEVSIAVLTGSVPTSVKVGETYDASNIQAILTYSGSSTDPKELTAADLTVSAIDTTTAGDKTLTVSYNGLVTTVTVKVVGVETLTVITNSVSNEILKGAAFDTSKISVSVKYTDGTSGVVGESALTLGAIDTTKAGEQKLTITYLDKTIEHTVKVCEVTSIIATGVASSAQSGKPIDISGLKVYGVYNDSKESTVELKDGITTNIAELNTTHLNSIEARTLTVSYNGELGTFTTSLTIYTTAADLTGIEIRNHDKEVLLYNAYNKNSVVVYATYGNGTEKRVTGFTVTDVATNVAGNVKFTVSYTEGGITKTAEETVKVCEITQIVIEGVAGSVPSGDAIDISGMKVFGVYNDTNETKVELTDGTITTNVDEIDINTLDAKTLTVSYTGMYGTFSTNHTITATPSALVGITIQEYADKVLINGTYDKSSVVVIANYKNNTSREVTGFTVSDVDTTTAGDVTLKVTYEGKEATKTVTVCTVTHIVIKGVAVYLPAGEVLNISGMEIWGVYNDSDTNPTQIRLTAGQYTTNKAEIDANTDENATLTFKVTYTDEVWGELKGTLVISAQEPVLERIEITKYDNEVLKGATYNKGSVVIKAFYGNGTSEEVTGFTVSDIDTTAAGKVTLKATYEDKETTVEVTVCEVTSIRVDGVADSVQSGNVINLDNMKVIGVYNDSKHSIVELTDGTITTNVDEIDWNLEGLCTLTVNYAGTYGEFTATHQITRTAPALTGITIEKHTAEVLLGRDYGKSDVTVKASYGNSTEKYVTNFSMTPVSTAVGGNVTFTVSYTEGGVTKTAQATVKVCEIVELIIDGIANSVKFGENVDITGIVVYGIYNDSMETMVHLTDGFTTNIDTINANVNNANNRVLEVAYGNAVGTYTIYVTAPKFVAIEVVSWDKTVGIGTPYNKDSIAIKGVVENGTYGYIVGELNISDIDTSALGRVTFTVTYEGPDGVTMTATAEVEVVGVENLKISDDTIPTLVNKGSTLATDGVVVTVTYADGSVRIVGKNDGVTVSTPDTSSAGEKQLTVSYCGFSTQYTYTVSEVVKIEIFSGLPYIIRTGYAIDYSALKLKITYSNGKEEIVAAASLPGVDYDGKEVGDTTFTVKYAGCSVSRTLVVARLHQIHALNGTIPGSVLVGTSLDYSSFRITLVYRYNDNGVDKEDIVLVDLNDPALLWNAGKQYSESGYVPASYLPGIGLDTSKAGELIVQFMYLPTGGTADDFNEMGIPLYQAQAKIIVIDVESIAIVPGTVPSSVKLGQEYDIFDLKVEVAYTDGTRKYISLSDLTYVSALDTSVAGKQTFTVKYLDHEATYEVTVVDTNVGTSVDGMIFGAMLPDSLIARDTYKKNFKDNDNMYVVGDDNPYYLHLNVAVLNTENKLVDVDGEYVATSVQVYEITDGKNTLLEGDNLAAVVTFTPAVNSDNPDLRTKNTYQFTPAAVGRSFRLEIRPAANYVGTDAIKHEIKVVDGYNIYDEKELNLLTNSYGDWTCEDLNENISSLGRSDQGTVAQDFLTANGITTDPNSISAVILHRNMTIEVEDLPPEYFHTYTKDGVTKTELIDHLEVYHRLVPTNQPFYFYGNYYSVFSYNLPCVVPKSVWNNVDEYSNSTLFCFRFDIRDYWALAGRTDYDQIEYPDSKQVAYVVDAGFRDNDPNSNDQSASERHMRGLTCFTNKAVTTNITNVNVEAFVVALRPEGSNCTVNLDQVKFYNCWQGQIFVWNDNGFQLDNWASLGGNVEEMTTLPGRFGAKIYIEDSLLGKCGGPVILAQSYMANKAANNELSIDVVVDDKSVLYSYVTGQEAWFVAVNQTAMAAQISALDAVVKGTAGAQNINASYLSDQKIQGVKTMNMVMVVMGAGVVSGEQYSGSFSKGYKDGNGQWHVTNVMMQMIKDASVNNPSKVEDGATKYPQPWLYDRYMSFEKSSQAPIFTTSAGGHCYAAIGESPACYTYYNPGADSAEYLYENFASGSAFEGDYITMYMYGMGIMLEYYH